MKQHVTYHLIGETPLVMHNGQLSDPRNAWTTAKQRLTATRPQTDAEAAEVARLEWMGSLYLFRGAPCIPRAAIQAMVVQAGTLLHKGPQVRTGLVCEAPAPVQYDGPRDPHALWAAGRCRLSMRKPLQGQWVVRTRPLFFPWAAEIRLAFNEAILTRDEVDELVALGGHTIGFLEERPTYGRYAVRPR